MLYGTICLLQTAVEAVNYVYEYCIGNDNITQAEIQEILVEIMDEEFDTICEDNSPFGRFKQLTLEATILSEVT